MHIFDFFNPYFKNEDCVVTVGVFDGLHKGHIKIVQECVNLSHLYNCHSVVVCFNKNPKMQQGTEKTVKPLLSDADFKNILNQTNVSCLAIIDFSENISKLSGEDFIALLCSVYKLRAIVIGRDFRCGNSLRSSGCSEIQRFLSLHSPNTFLKVVSSVYEGDTQVSSTEIRKNLLSGKIETASLLLGRSYSLDLSSSLYISGCSSYYKPHYNSEYNSDYNPGYNLGYNSESGCLNYGCLRYSCKDLQQLLPCAGTYRTKIFGMTADSPTPGSLDCNATAVITEEELTLFPEKKIKPNRLFFL